MSGLNQQFTKLSFLNWNREFESHTLRQVISSVCIVIRLNGERKEKSSFFPFNTQLESRKPKSCLFSLTSELIKISLARSERALSTS